MRAHIPFNTARCSDYSRSAILLVSAVISASMTAEAQFTTERVPLRGNSPISNSPNLSDDTMAALSRGGQKNMGEAVSKQDVPIGVLTTQYIDPEFSSRERQIVFQTHVGSVWVGDIDPQTGLLVTASGKDYLLATGAAPLVSTAQGPEFGRDSTGASVYFTKTYNFGLQLWRSRLEDGVAKTERITGGVMPRRTVCPSANPELESVSLLYLRGPSTNFSWASTDERSPGSELLMPEILSGVSGPRWIPGTDEFIYLLDVDGSREIAKTNAATGESRILTNDGGEKVDMFPFRAPEFDNEVLFFANVNQTELAIYRNLGGSFYDRILTLTPPAGAEYQYMVSVEPFAAGGRTYFTLEMHKTPAFLLSRDSSIWVFDMNADPDTRFARRLDDGSVAHRVEAEWFIGSNEVFIYYSLVDYLGRWELHRTLIANAAMTPTTTVLCVVGYFDLLVTLPVRELDNRTRAASPLVLQASPSIREPMVADREWSTNKLPTKRGFRWFPVV